MKQKQFYIGVACMLLLCTGCSSGTQAEAANNETYYVSNIDQANLFSDRDYEIGYEEQTAIPITCTGDSATCDADVVTIENGIVTIGAEGTYVLSGTLNNGMVIVNVSDTEKVQLVLDGVTITSATSAAIYVHSADKVFVTTTADSINVLKNGGSYEAIDENNIDGVIFAKSDITFNGEGTLQISADVEHGIVTKDDLTITSGTYDIAVAGHGLSGKDSVAIADGVFTLTTGKDGIQSDNTEDTQKGYVYIGNGIYNMTCEGDGVSASSDLMVSGGTYTMVTGGGSVNGESHTEQQNFMGGMRKTPPTDGTVPTDGMQPPDGTMPTDGMQPPDGTMPTDGMQPPDGTVPADGTVPPERPDKNITNDMNETVSNETTETTTAEDTTSDTPSTKGFKAGTTLTITNGTFDLDCADDGFHSNGTVTYSGGTAIISSGGKAVHADVDVWVENGEIGIETCFEGLEGQNVTVTGGTIDMFATDDGINAASDTVSNKDDINITITGGVIDMDAGGDGLDSNGNIDISGGTISVSSAAQGADTPLDYDGTATITGGILIGVGANGMLQNFGTTSTQCAVLSTVENTDSTITITDEAGTVLLTYESPKRFSSVLFSCPELEVGETYTITTGTTETEITLEDIITGSGMTASGRMNGGKGNRMEMMTTENV